MVVKRSRMLVKFLFPSHPGKKGENSDHIFSKYNGKRNFKYPAESYY